jgi:Arc/MetJ family transcription regulator
MKKSDFITTRTSWVLMNYLQHLRMCKLLHKETHMATNLALDPALLDKVVAVSGEPTKKAAVTLALKEFIARREQKGVSALFGKLEWDATYDYKAERSRS